MTYFFLKLTFNIFFFWCILYELSVLIKIMNHDYESKHDD